MDDPIAALARFQRMRRVVLFIIISVAIVLLLFCGSDPAYSDVHEIVEAAGLSLIALAITGRLWSILYIGGRKSREIVDIGPYSLTRNPLYLFSAIGAAGVGAQTGSVSIGILFFLGAALAFHFVIRREERYLATQFAEPYRDYLARVPRFFPRLRGFRDADEIVVSTRRIYSTFFDGLVFFLAIPAFEAIEWLQATGYLPVLLRVV